MHNILLIAVLLLVVGLAGRYVYQAKKSGEKCIGCPQSGSCNACTTSECHSDK